MVLMNKLGYLIGEGFRSVFTHGFMSFASVTIIIACLTIMGSFSLLAVNIDGMIEDLEQENEMLAFVDETVAEEDARSIEALILAVPNVSSVRFVSREEAMESFKDDYENSSVFDDLDATVFRHRYIIYLDDIAKMAETKTDVETVEGIAEVSAQLEISNGLVTIRNIVSAVSLILIVILIVVSIFIMSNTIKLTTFSRREEIAIMKMVGATNSFIRTPFIFEGLVLGVVGSVVAFALQWGIYSFVSDKVMNSFANAYITVIPFGDLMTPLALVFVGVGVAVGLFGGSIAIRNYLKV